MNAQEVIETQRYMNSPAGRVESARPLTEQESEKLIAQYGPLAPGVEVWRVVKALCTYGGGAVAWYAAFRDGVYTGRVHIPKTPDWGHDLEYQDETTETEGVRERRLKMLETSRRSLGLADSTTADGSR